MQNEMNLIAKEILNKCKFYSPKQEDKKKIYKLNIKHIFF